MTSILLDHHCGPMGSTLLLEDPVDILRADTQKNVLEVVRALEQKIRKEGLWAAGFFSYELGYALEPALHGLMPAHRNVPLLWFALFKPDQARYLHVEQRQEWLGGNQDISRPVPVPQISQPAYDEKFSAVQRLISAGDIYQLNLTFKARFSTASPPRALYHALQHRQRVAHGAYIESSEFHILSLSPELFLNVAEGHAQTRPMKGTASRGLSAASDQKMREMLRSDEKSRAENLMITDLMRNDLGRIAALNGVSVPSLFDVETYETLHQMTSKVCARLRQGVGLTDILRAAFPPGSIIGAPKIRAQQIIRELEEEPRGVYTGSIGLLRPDKQSDVQGGGIAAHLNVAIRTLYLQPEAGEALGQSGGYSGEIGVGGGLVADSDRTSEWREALLKMKFMVQDRPEFGLIETLKYERAKGFFLLDRHMQRLAQSAAYFDYPIDIKGAQRKLETAALAAIEGHDVLRVRLVLAATGKIAITSVPLEPALPVNELKFVFSRKTVDRNLVFLYHKTTERHLFESELAHWQKVAGADEVLFFNGQGEMTEGSRSSVFLEKDGKLLTPPLSSGLLPGTLRAQLLAEGRAVEQVLDREDLAAADAVYFGNSVRGLQRAKILVPTQIET